MSLPDRSPTPSQPARAGYPGPGAPPPPPGPGAFPPFVAPPAERNRKRLWLGLSLGGLALVVCCGGGIASIVGLGVATQRALVNESTRTVTTYLSDLRDGDYNGAYGLLCADRAHEQTLDQFAARQRDQSRPVSFTLDKPQTSGSEVDVPATVQAADGSSVTVTYELVRDDAGGPLKICGAR